MLTMKLRIDPKIFEQHPDLKIGAIVIKGINNAKRVSAVESLLRGICAQRGKQFAEKDLSEENMIKCWNQAYGRFGINPKKNMPSIAALLKRVSSGKEIPHINILVDLYNYFSMKLLLPIGGEDLDWLCGDLNLTFTKGGEAFRPIGSIEVERAKEGEVAYIDDGGITCRYWNHRECERTKFTTKTSNAVILIEDLSRMHMDEFGSILKEVQNAIIKYVGGRIEPYILNEESPEIDLGIQGRPQADDAKIPEQEKVHYMVQEKLETQELSQDELEPSEDTSPQTEEEAKKKASDPISQPSSKLELEDENTFAYKLKLLLQAALKAAFNLDLDPLLEYPAQEDHGDYASNIALRISKDLERNPRDIAEELIAKIPENQLIDKIAVAGPGFINFFLSKEALEQETQKVLQEKEQYGSSHIGKDKSIVVEYSQPNIAKPLGVHHLLSTIIGQTIYNIFHKLGFKAISVNHTGDWGTQFGKLIYAYKQWGDKATVESDPINELFKLYVKFHDEAEKNPSLEDNGREEFRKFEEGDKENRELWQWFVDESMKEINKTYQLLGGVHFDHMHPESFYEDKMNTILEEGKSKHIFTEGKEGALVIEYDDPNIPTLPIIKKDGATLYITRDFAALKYRIETWNPLKILYVVDVAQSLHFKQLLTGAGKFSWYKPVGEHISFGRMQMKESRMSTRKGNVILLNDVISEAIDRAKELIQTKSPELNDHDEVARVVGIGAVKYSVLSQNRTTNITFDWDKMLSFDGNSAPYLQYSYARAKSILRKVNEEQSGTIKDPEQTEDKINSLIRSFPKFSEELLHAAMEYKPNTIANYLLDLASKFNSFYNSVPVLKASDSESKKKRLEIVEATAQILKNGLNILGIEVVEEM